MPITRVLVPVDGSDCAQRALAFAVDLARCQGAALDIVTVLDIGQLDYHDTMLLTDEQLDRWQEQVRADILAGALERVPEGLAVTSHVLRGQVAQAILAHLRTSGADHVVIGRVGRGVLDRMLHGSVSRKLSVTCPVPITLVA